MLRPSPGPGAGAGTMVPVGFIIVACAAGPSAALSGVAGTADKYAADRTKPEAELEEAEIAEELDEVADDKLICPPCVFRFVFIGWGASVSDVVDDDNDDGW